MLGSYTNFTSQNIEKYADWTILTKIVGYFLELYGKFNFRKNLKDRNIAFGFSRHKSVGEIESVARLTGFALDKAEYVLEQSNKT